MNAGELTDDDIGRYIELGPGRPFARGRLLAVERRAAGLVLRIEHTNYGATFPVTAPVAEDAPVTLP